MAKVNAPNQMLPESILKNEDLADVLQDILFNIFQLWVRTGKSSDFVTDSMQNGYEFDDLLKLEIKKREISTQSTDYTTSLNETVICTNTNAIKITLNDEPEDEELVQIKITDNNVTIDANGRLLDGQSSITFISSRLQGQPMIDCFYSLENDAWYIV